MKQQSTRIGYIDAIKGMSIIAIVLWHISGDNPGGGQYSPFVKLVTTFSLPLFFFVSGYFAYRRPEDWSVEKIRTSLTSKFFGQIFGMALIWFVYQYATNGSLSIFIYDGFAKYWFTVGLFQIFIIYLFISRLALSTKSSHLENILLMVIAIGTVAFVAKEGYGKLYEYRILRVLSWAGLLPYAQFFIFGLFFRKYYEIVLKLILSQWFRFSAIVIFIVSTLFIFSPGIEQNHHFLYSIFYGEISKWSGMLTVFIVFYTWRDYFASTTLAARFLQVTGSHTLDIYYLHYFFIPVIPGIGVIMDNPANNVVILQIVVLIVAALAVVGASLLVSAVLRTSPLMARMLFGTKMNLAK